MSSPTPSGGDPARRAVWAPLRRPPFRSLWSAFFGCQLVVWMHGVGAATVIAGLSSSPTLVASVQTAIALPTVLVGLVAGAVADMVDRRRLLLVTQVWILSSVAALTALTLADAVTPALVLVLTFAVGAGIATGIPAFQSLLPQILEPAAIRSGVALIGIAINLARAVGPALAGAVIVAAGAGVLFALETVLLVLILWPLLTLKPRQRVAPAAERLAAAIGTGVRYARRTAAVRVVLVRVVVFVAGASAFWALLPVMAFGPLDVGSGGLGVLVGFAGIGALCSAALLPRLEAWAPDAVVAAASLLLGGALCVLALLEVPPVAAVASFLAGAAWLSVITSLNTAAHFAANDHVRGRTLATFQLFFQGALAFASLAWGLLAEAAGPELALVVAAALLAAGVGAAARWRLEPAEATGIAG